MEEENLVATKIKIQISKHELIHVGRVNLFSHTFYQATCTEIKSMMMEFLKWVMEYAMSVCKPLH